MTYKPFNRDFIQIGYQLPFTVYIQLNEYKCVPLVNKGEEVTLEEIERINKYEDQLLLIDKKDHIEYVVGKEIDEILASFPEDNDPLPMDQGEKLFDLAFERDENESEKDYFEGVIQKSNLIIKKYFKTEESVKDPTSIYNFINELSDNEGNIESHILQLNSLGCLLLLSTPGAEPNHLEEYSILSELHGYGLQIQYEKQSKSIFSKFLNVDDLKVDVASSAESKTMVVNHINGNLLSDLNETSEYLKHFYVAEKAFEASPYKKVQGVSKAIHHLKTMQTPRELKSTKTPANYYLVSKVFNIIDLTLTQIHKNLSAGMTEENIFKKSLSQVTKLNHFDESPFIYDEAIYENLISRF